MQVFRGVHERALGTAAVPAAPNPVALTIGNFDGVHLGHRALLGHLTGKARALGLASAVLSFEPHPRELFTPDQAPARLSSLREKLELLADCNVDRSYICRFNRQLAALPADEFVERILVRGLGVRYLVIGDDFRFGKARGGDLSLLQSMGARLGFEAEAMPTVDLGGLRVSSSAVREALAVGDIEQAERLLGRPYVISGRVGHGEKIGRTLGYPTANIRIKHARLPLTGIFAVSVFGLDADPTAPPVRGAASLGVRPTLGDGLKPVLEVHLLDFDRDIYGAHVRVNFLHKLREEAKFDSLEALREQIAADVAAVRNYFIGM